MTPTATLPADLLHAAFGEAFSDYLIGPFQLPLALWPGFLARQGVDLDLGRAVLDQGQLQAFALVAPRPDIGRWRLATMGAVPAARGSGSAPRLLDDLLQRARAAGQQAVELEVFAQNERALRLYRSRGFEPRHTLHGYQAAAGVVAPVREAGAEIDAGLAMDWLRDVARARVADLPLQVTDLVLRNAAALRAWRCGTAQLLASQAPDGSVNIASLIDLDPAQRDAQVLLQALRAEFPHSLLRVPQLQRLDLGGQALRALGFEPQPLHQLLMVCPL